VIPIIFEILTSISGISELIVVFPFSLVLRTLLFVVLFPFVLIFSSVLAFSSVVAFSLVVVLSMFASSLLPFSTVSLVVAGSGVPYFSSNQTLLAKAAFPNST